MRGPSDRALQTSPFVTLERIYSLMNRLRNVRFAGSTGSLVVGALMVCAPLVALAQTRPVTGGFGGGGNGNASGTGGASASGGFGGAGASVDAGARASAPVVQSFPPSQAREEIVGYDGALGALTYVERTPTRVGGFAQTALIAVNTRGERNRIPLTTNVDEDRLRTSRDAGIFREIDARVVRSIAEARARLGGGGSVLPVSEVNPRSNPSQCVHAPYAAREFTLGDLGTVRLTVAPDERSTRIQVTRAGRSGTAVDIPAVAFTTGASGQQLFIPYNRVADARELPGTDRLAVLLRSDACTPEGVQSMVSGVLLDPPGDQPLPPLEHVELTEADVLRVIAPRARRRTIDEVSGWYDRDRTRVVYDNAWRVPGSYELAVVQFSRHPPSLSPTIAMSGHASAHYALFRTGGRRPEMIFQFAPSVTGVYEGISQEALGADLDGDGRPEVIIRARMQDDAEHLVVLRTSESDLNFAWTGEVNVDGRRGGVSQCCTNNVVRHCSVGLDGRSLILRCRHETYSGIGPEARVVSSRVRIERLRYNGGSAALEVMER